jgi:hypothetical protein
MNRTLTSLFRDEKKLLGLCFTGFTGLLGHPEEVPTPPKDPRAYVLFIITVDIGIWCLALILGLIVKFEARHKFGQKEILATVANTRPEDRDDKIRRLCKRYKIKIKY